MTTHTREHPAAPRHSRAARWSLRLGAWLVLLFPFCVVGCKPYLPPKPPTVAAKDTMMSRLSKHLRWSYPPLRTAAAAQGPQPIILEQIASSPVLGKKALYITTLDGKLYAFDFAGKLMWKFQDRSNPHALIVASPVVGPDGTVYFGTKNNIVYGVKDNGQAKWKDFVGGPVTTRLLATKDAIYVAIPTKGMLQAFSHSGKRLWSCDVGVGEDEQELMTPVEAPDGTLYLASQDGYVLAISPKERRTIWRKKFCQKVTAPPALAKDGSLYLSCWHRDDQKPWKGRLLHIQTDERKEHWHFKTQAPIATMPVLSKDQNTVYIGSDDTFFYAVSAKHGKQQWKFQSGRYPTKSAAKPRPGSPSYIQANVVYSDDKQLYFGAVNHLLYALSPKGKLLWHFDLGAWIIHAPTFHKSPSGIRRLYVAAGRRLFAFGL